MLFAKEEEVRGLRQSLEVKLADFGAEGLEVGGVGGHQRQEDRATKSKNG